MELAYLLGSSSAPRIRKYQVGASVTTAGIPFVVGGTGEEGIVAASTTAAANACGVGMETVTVLAAQQSDNSDPARTINVIISPDAVYRARMSGGATSNTALTLFDVTTAATDGLTVTTGDTWTGTEFLDGVVWGYDGANAGVIRKITATGATSCTVTVAFPYDTVVGDNFLRAPYAPSPEDQFVQLTTTLEQLNASVAVDTNNTNFRIVELECRDIGSNGTVNSNALIMFYDHLFAAGGSI